MKTRNIVGWVALIGGLIAPAYAAAQEGALPAAGTPQVLLKHQPAMQIPGAAEKSMMLSATNTGRRIVAVGDYGVVLLSDDDGLTFRQAKGVPTRVTLTGVTFVDEHEGWAVGHWGVVLHTVDGGETWSILRDELSADRPLFTVWFKDKQTGYAAGLWSHMLVTHDGGKSWQEIKMPKGGGSAKADLNLWRIFSDQKGMLFVVSERGVVFESANGGESWVAVETGNRGTFWTGIALKSGAVLVAGLRGKAYRSADGGRTWRPSETNTMSSITDIAQLSDGKVYAVGLDGVWLVSDDDGVTFKAGQREDRLSMTTLTINDKVQPIVFSKGGVVRKQ